ncbi:HAD-IC family P-type ATPase [Hahella sp. KA22]|uniref:cation-translocating P-type ATPase n=1 Tax=Hahella sp. KA22 TaxID=1628392 RepID=UPI001F4D3EF8|nr:HAD-IC family P-type ATPase [Hahella sp. KA22]
MNGLHTPQRPSPAPGEIISGLPHVTPPDCWHASPIEKTLAAMKTDTDGLSSSEAEERLRRHGENIIAEQSGESAWQRLLRQFNNPLIYVLLLSAAITLIMRHWLDASVILMVVVINGLIGYLQEGRAEKALQAIRRMVTFTVSVRRDGRLQSLPASVLVPGDIVLLQAGDRAPADMRLIQTSDLHISEAVLTGESEAVSKQTQPASPDTELAGRTCMAYAGSLVTRGQGHGVVVATGENTEFGKISALLRQVNAVETPLLKQMAEFSAKLSWWILLLSAVCFMTGYWLRDYSAADMFLAAVGLAVAAIPEGLPAILTITLALGVQMMAKRNAIVRRMPAVETLGAVTVICTDKTGTLTKNEMTVVSLDAGENSMEVSGAGYDPHGEITFDERLISAQNHPQLARLSLTALLCNDADIHKQDDIWTPQGDPTEAALVTFAAKAGWDGAQARKDHPRLDVLPFSADNLYMATLHHDSNGSHFICIKGAPERVLQLCSATLSEEDTQRWSTRFNQRAAQGQRLLAFAYITTPDAIAALPPQLPLANIQFLGAVAMIDPPREETAPALAKTLQAGIVVKMITGDNPKTAQAIAESIHLPVGDGVITGADIDNLDDEALKAAALRCNIFARTTPLHKLRLVEALQQSGEIVAMTGDGVNDAPALKRAGIGVAMGRQGTEVAKEAAQIILLDDNFSTITAAVEEGRRIFDNFKKAIVFVLPTSCGEALMILAAVVLGVAMPITPVQILWINMVTAVTLALALSFEPAEPNIMARPPRRPGESLLDPLLLWRVLSVSLIMVLGSFGLFGWTQSTGASLEHARTVAVNTLVMFEIFYLFNTRMLMENITSWRQLTSNRMALYSVAILLLFQLLFTYAPPMQRLFSSTALSPSDWLAIALVGSSVFIITEIEKFVMRVVKGQKNSD